MLLVSAVSFSVWRMIKNFQLLRDYARRNLAGYGMLPVRTKATMLKQSLNMAGGPGVNAGNKLSYALGLRRVEKAGIEAV